MNSRKRKKWLKKQDLYVNPKETWNLNERIAKYMIPRLKEFKKLNICYPGIGDMDTPEKWDEALDKMIHAFELSQDLPINCLFDENDKLLSNWEEIAEKRNADIQEGLHLFATWFEHLWW